MATRFVVPGSEENWNYSACLCKNCLKKHDNVEAIVGKGNRFDTVLAKY